MEYWYNNHNFGIAVRHGKWNSSPSSPAGLTHDTARAIPEEKAWVAGYV